MENKRAVGRRYEEAARRFLEKKGFVFREKNYRAGGGEIDLIMQKDGRISFIEVKYRKDARYGHPEEAVDGKKQRRIRQCALRYLWQNGLTEREISFDVVAFEGRRVRYLPDAFE